MTYLLTAEFVTVVYTDDETTATHLMALYPGRPVWAGVRKNVHSLTLYPCGYYTTSL